MKLCNPNNVAMIKSKESMQLIDMRIHLTIEILTNYVLSFESFIVSRKNDSKRYFDTGINKVILLLNPKSDFWNAF